LKTGGRQAGFGTLILALVILTGLTIVIFYAAHTGLMKQRIVGNEIRTREALEAAEAGVERAMTFLEANREFIADDTVTGGWAVPGSERWLSCGPQSTTIPCSVLPGTEAPANYVAYTGDGANVTRLPGTDSDGPISKPPGGYTSPATGDAPAEVWVAARCADEDEDGACDGIAPQLGTGSAFLIVATGYSADQTGEATVQQGVSLYPLISSPPDAPLIASAAMGLSGNIEVVTNPNGGGPGVPLSVWSSENVNIGSSATTCQLSEYLWSASSANPSYDEDGIEKCDPNSCSCSGADDTGILSSNSVGKGDDIVDSAADFPSDLFAYLFGYSRDDWQEVYQDAQILDGSAGAACSDLNASSSGLYWLTVDCTLNNNQVVGSVDKPVILVLDEVELTLNGGAEIYGLVFVFDKDGDGNSAEANMSTNGTALVYGAIVAEGVDITNGTFTVRYEKKVLENLERTGKNQAVAKIPGAWRDFNL
jgi:hypothetical protein